MKVISNSKNKKTYLLDHLWIKVKYKHNRLRFWIHLCKKEKNTIKNQEIKLNKINKKITKNKLISSKNKRIFCKQFCNTRTIFKNKFKTKLKILLE